jgi:hypothetical protein
MDKSFILRATVAMAAGALIAALGVVAFYELKLCRCAPECSLFCRQRREHIKDEDLEKYIL